MINLKRFIDVKWNKLRNRRSLLLMFIQLLMLGCRVSKAQDLNAQNTARKKMVKGRKRIIAQIDGWFKMEYCNEKAFTYPSYSLEWARCKNATGLKSSIIDGINYRNGKKSVDWLTELCSVSDLESIFFIYCEHIFIINIKCCKIPKTAQD